LIGVVVSFKHEVEGADSSARPEEIRLVRKIRHQRCSEHCIRSSRAELEAHSERMCRIQGFDIHASMFRYWRGRSWRGLRRLDDAATHCGTVECREAGVQRGSPRFHRSLLLRSFYPNSLFREVYDHCRRRMHRVRFAKKEGSL